MRAAAERTPWRGYALTRLAEYFGLGGASLVLGVVWAVWHIPLFVLPDSGSTGQSFPAYLLQVMAMSVVLAFLCWKTDGSLALAMECALRRAATRAAHERPRSSISAI